MRTLVSWWLYYHPMTTATAQVAANIAIIKCWGTKEMFTSTWEHSINILCSKSHTLFGRNFTLISNSLTVDWQNSAELMEKFLVDLSSKAFFWSIKEENSPGF